jgi:hypothetical protein
MVSDGMGEGQRVRIGRGAMVGVVGVSLAIASVVAGEQAGSNQAPNRAQQTYPYPVVRDLRGVVPPGPKPLPSPPLGDGPWTFQTTEAKIRVSASAMFVKAPTDCCTS